MGQWRPVDVIVATLTVVISSAIVAGIFAGPTAGEYAEFKLKMYQGLFTGIMSIISLYVGARLQAQAERRNNGTTITNPKDT